MNHTLRKRLLLVTYYWPPCGGPGSIRPVKFAKYLPGFRIDPIILTRKNIAYHSLDFELGSELKNIIVHRTESLDPARILYYLGIRKYQPAKWQVPIKKTMNFPDNKIGWIPFAFARGQKIDFDCILVTAPPFSAFITGYMVGKNTGKPLILDFRDAWLEFPFMPYETEIQKKFVLYWEKKLTQFASAIVAISEDIRTALVRRYPMLAEKISVIPNGYDPDDFSRVTYPEKFTISYLGTIRRERNPETILKAVSEFVQINKLSADEVELKFIGHIEKEFLKMIKLYPFTRVLGHLSYQKALREFCNAHLAVMITTGDEFFFPSRQNEYLASGLPIICCGKSEGIQILKNAYKKGYPVWIYEYKDYSAISKKISEVFIMYKNN